jgi:hypothetical protein
MSLFNMSETISFSILNFLHNSMNEISNHFTRNFLASLNLNANFALVNNFPEYLLEHHIHKYEHTQFLQMYLFSVFS